MRHFKHFPTKFAPALCLAALCLLPGGVARAAKGKWTPGINVSKAVARVVGAAKAIAQQSDYGFDNFCFSGSLVRSGGQISDSLPMRGGVNYLLLGAGDDYAKDVDLVLKDANGKVVASHTTANATALVKYQPAQSGVYQIVLRLKKSSHSDSFCAYAILRKGGVDVPLQNLSTAISRCIAICTQVAGFEGGARLHQSRHGAVHEFTGAVTARIVQQSETSGFTGELEKGRHAFVIAADDNARTLHFGLIDSSKRIMAKRIGQGAIKCLTSNKTYLLGYQNVQSNGPTLVVTAALDLPPTQRKGR